MDDEKNIVESDIKTSCEITLKALAASIPGLGGVLSSLMGDLQSLRKEKRFLEFLEGMKKNLEGMEEYVNQSFIREEDFLDIFEETSKKIVDTRQEEKREAFKNILANSLLSDNISYDKVEEFIRLIDRLRVEHISILRILKDPFSYDRQTGSRVGEGGGLISSISQIMQTLLPDWQEADIIEVLSTLENERLAQHMVNSFKGQIVDQGINHLRNKLTDKGYKFCSFIFEKK